MAASTAYFAILLMVNRRIGLALLPIPIAIGFSRIYVAAHYLSDVVCAAVLGILCALLVWNLGRRRLNEDEEEAEEQARRG